ncbi:hypothetical protein NESM_000415300 [Novymonas esmeraldas]|uniref:Gamma-butyrobetaine hydroxylase-like N-terminal domain-containing protein n=1 Tax=Novymonas esmeraldas TaxID=1808958 RepID=A0AAW0EPP6_9TRYP
MRCVSRSCTSSSAVSVAVASVARSSSSSSSPSPPSSSSSLPLLRRRWTTCALHHPCTVHLSRRCFSSSLLGRLGDSVATTVSQLAETVWLAEDRLVTEPRRMLQPQRVSTASLAERLAAQRRVRQRLVPTSVKVDKSRQYVEFVWPADVAEVMRGVSLEAPATAAAAEAESAAAAAASSSSSSHSPLPSRPFISATGAPASLEHHATTTTTTTATAAAAAAAAAVCASPNVRASCLPEEPPLRTRALAEYLRAYTPSTDGAVGSQDIIIYGRRGVTISKIIPVGNYALRFIFSDDHSGGIYSYEYLYYLTGPATKYGLMRGYITELRRRRKSRDPPRRAASTRYATALTRGAGAAAAASPPLP